MTYTDDYWTIRIPRCVGYRTLCLNAIVILCGALCILASWHAEAAAAAMLVALLNGVARLCTRTPVAARANPLGAIWTPKRADQPVMHGLVAQVDAVRPVASTQAAGLSCGNPVQDAVLVTELATMLADQRHLTSEPVFVPAQTRLEAAAARMARAPRATTFHASTVVLTFLGTAWASFVLSLAVMVA